MNTHCMLFCSVSIKQIQSTLFGVLLLYPFLCQNQHNAKCCLTLFLRVWEFLTYLCWPLSLTSQNMACNSNLQMQKHVSVMTPDHKCIHKKCIQKNVLKCKFHYISYRIHGDVIKTRGEMSASVNI